MKIFKSFTEQNFSKIILIFNFNSVFFNILIKENNQF